jgi:dimethylhistidine N-methyltransferase/ergothioneine biosynthesis protein EgtC
VCRHLAYLGPELSLARLLTEPEHSLYRQSWAPRLQRYGTVNADGFGIGWYPAHKSDDGAQDGNGIDDSAQPARYRRAVPIWSDANLTDLADVIHSGAVLAAVRCATAGTGLEECAAAPFREGRWLFSHNGAVPDWTRLPTPGLDAADLLGLEARSDSAVLWAMIAQRLRRREPAAGVLASVVRDCADARPDARLNLLLTDGRTITATRHGDTLWYRAEPGQVLVASEPSDDVGDWREVPDNSVLVASKAGVKIAMIRPTTTESGNPRSAAEAARATDGRFTLVNSLPDDYHATTLHRDVSEGLSARPKTLPPKWFYDDRGGELFDEITRLPEYYPTRAEREILTRRAPEIAALTRACSLVELGSGSSSKTRLLLDALTAVGTLTCYAPIDVNAAALTGAGTALCRDYPGLRVAATVADVETSLPLPQEPGPRLIAFLGSTIGNFDTTQRAEFFRTMRYALSGDDSFLLGADLVKDPAVLVRAYDDSQGVTAAFNKNVLDVLNRELDADFDPDAFEHRAVWNADEERIEMHLRSRAAQTVKIPALDLTAHFDPGEDLRTEISVKFRRDALTAELAAAGFTLRRWWTDQAARFALLLAVPDK